MTPDDGIVQLLKADAAVSGLTGGHVFPDVAPQVDENGDQVTLPYICVQANGGESDVYLDGPGTKSQGSWEVTVYDSEPTRCATVAAFAHAALNGFSGYSSGILFEGMWCDVVSAQTDEDDAAPDGFWRMRRFNVSSWFSQTLDPQSYPDDAASVSVSS